MLVSRSNGWTVDTATDKLSWPGSAHAGEVALPDATKAALVYFGLGYLESQAAARTVNDTFRKAWLAAHEGSKAGDVPRDAVPASDSAEYRAELAKAHEALFAKLVAGYEVGVREGSGDPLADETGSYIYGATVSASRPQADYTARVLPHYEGVAIPLEDARILWQH